MKRFAVLAFSLALIKVLHEMGHALACKHFGGECHELGLMLLVFASVREQREKLAERIETVRLRSAPSHRSSCSDPASASGKGLAMRSAMSPRATASAS